MTTCLLLLGGSGLLCHAATAISSSCSVTVWSAGGTAQTNDTNPLGGCGTIGSGVASSFSASASLSGTQTAMSSSFSGLVSAFGGPMGVFSGMADAQIQGTNNMVLMTGGDVRQGYLAVLVQLTPENSAGDSVGFSSSFNIGSFSATCGGSVANAHCGNLYGLRNNGYYSFVSPFTLGQSFAFGQTFNLSAFDTSADSPASVAALNISYELTELDGTPVTVYATPEPSAFGLSVVGCGAVLAAAIYAKKRTSVLN